MRKNLIKTGAEVLDKITGQVMVITGVTDGIATIYPKDADQETEQPKLITEDNAICFRFLRNDTKTPVENASLEDGILTVNGNQIEIGSLKLSAILGTLPGRVVLTAEADTAKEDLYIYDVDRDRFASVGKGLAVEGTSVMATANAIVVLNTDTVKETQDDGTVKDVATADQLYVIGTDGIGRAECEVSALKDVAVFGQDLYILAEGHSVNDGEAPFVQVFRFDNEMADLELVMDPEIEAGLITAGQFGVTAFAKDSIAVKYGDRDYLLSAPDITAKVNPDGAALVVVDVTGKGDTLTVTFADPETYATATVQSIRTRDRGDIVTVL